MAELDGEWWIIDGSASYADGDIGDMSHEAYVIEHVRADIAERVGERYEWGFTDWEEVLREITPEHDISEEELSIANGNGDARQYGLETLGWIRVMDGTFETWAFTKADRDSILSGLWDMDSEVGDDDVIHISVGSTGDYYSLTVAELEAMDSARPAMIDAELANAASVAVVRNRDVAALHPCYRGRIGD